MRSAILRRATCTVFVAICIMALSCQNPIANLGGNRDANTVPADWAGIWQIHVQTSLCTPDSVIFDSTHADTVCAGASLGDEFDIPALLSAGSTLDIGSMCSLVGPSLSGDHMTFSCSGSLGLNGCQNSASTTADLTLNRADHTYTGTGHFSLDVTPNDVTCGPDRCFNFTVSATRLSADSPGCPAKAGR